jgi:hypothetical protein
MRLPSRFHRIFNSSTALIHTAVPDGFFGFINQDVEGIVEKWGESPADGKPAHRQARVLCANCEYPWMLLHRKVGLVLRAVVCRAGVIARAERRL